MPAPTISPLPEAPSVADPAGFPTEASAFVAAQQSFADDVNAFGTYLNSQGFGDAATYLFATYGGTADAVTLTTVASYTSVVLGQMLRFRATATNNGAMTIKMDDDVAIAAKTVKGVDTPAGYIRTDVDTLAYYDGTNWIVGREIENDTNANGEYTRFADGTILMSESTALPQDAVSAGGIQPASGTAATEWTLPAGKVGGIIAGTPRGQQSSHTEGFVILISSRNVSGNLGWRLKFEKQMIAAWNRGIDFQFIGTWY